MNKCLDLEFNCKFIIKSIKELRKFDGYPLSQFANKNKKIGKLSTTFKGRNKCK